MTDSRRYDDDEVAAIFARAAELDAEATSRDEATRTRAVGVRETASHALTLREVQAIATEAGLAPSVVERAAAELDAPEIRVEPVRRAMGLPVGVAFEVTLPRPVTDDEWLAFVAELRETFDARGTLNEQGPFREWFNGNLQATLTPSGSGHKLRLRTTKGSARELLVLSAFFPAFGAIMSLMGLAAGKPKIFFVTGLFLAGGAVLYGTQAIALRRWSQTRSYQMRELLSNFVAQRLGSPRDPVVLPEVAGGAPEGAVLPVEPDRGDGP